MSSSNLKNGQNFEMLYNSLKSEYDQALLDNDEICKEYESTIELLKVTLEKATAEKEKLQVKNKEKLEDIQDLTKLNDKLKEDIKKIKEENKLKEAKIVFLENNNEHFENKIRQFEAIIDDLNSQLESTLEENITLQTEFEIYKQSTSEQLMRKDEELQDYKSDVINKEKIIQQLNTTTIMKKLEEKIKMTQKTLKQYQRKYSDTLLNKDIVDKDKNNNNLKNNTSLINNSINNNFHNQSDAKKNEQNYNHKLITPITNCKAVLPNKFQEIYKTSIKNVLEFTNPINDNKNSDDNDDNNINDDNNDNINDDNNDNIIDMNVLKNVKNNSHFILDSLNNTNTKKINEKEREEEKVNEEDSSSCFSYEKKIFENLVICNEKVFSVNSIKNLINDKLMKNKKLKENLQKLLALTTQRRSNLINREKGFKDRLFKIGFKIRD